MYAGRRIIRWLIMVLGAAAVVGAGFAAVPGALPTAVAAGCTGNKIVCENAKTGTASADWDVDGVGDPTIQGFGTQMSVNLGESIDFKIDTDARAYTIQIYRLGWYQGLGARKIADVTPSASLPQIQPACATDPATEIYDCGTWAVSATWAVPTDAVSGVYLAVLTRTDTGGRSHIPFVVRDDASTSTVVFQTSDATWQAYNTYGGSNFYSGRANGRAFKLSYNRPFVTRGLEDGRDYLFANEYPMLRFLERNGYDLSYLSSLDTDVRGQTLTQHKVFVSTGHDEYWSQGQRDNVEAARDAGVNLAFFSGNEMYWRTRWEASEDGSATANRTLVCYKDTWSSAPLDPVSPTSTWRDARGAAEPENAVTGTIYKSNNTDLPITVSGAEGKLRLWRNTGLGTQADTATTKLAPHTVGYESDEDLDNGYRPAGLMDLSTTVGETPQYLTDFGSTVTAGTTTHHLTLYKAASGALVFGAGTVQWAWGLDTYHDGTVEPVDVRMQQAMVNLFADMSALPGSLSTTGVVAATKSTDTTAPTAKITAPAASLALVQGAVVTVTGTATDTGGKVAGVEVSVDGGLTWHPATGRASWTYTGILTGSTTGSIRARAVDDSGNLQATPTSVTTVPTCPCSLFGATTPKVTAVSDTSNVTLGLRFTPRTDGFVTGVRFYKGTGNTGTHTGTLYSGTGQVLATVTFADETATGWQTASFSQAVAVTSGTTYVVAYTAPNGHYAADSWFFGYGGTSTTLLTALGGKDVNGVFANGADFPTRSYQQTNYWVDVVFNTVDLTPLAARSVTPLDGSGSVPTQTTVTATLTRDPIVSTVAMTLTTATGTKVAGTTRYDAATRTVTFTPTAPLANATTYTATVTAKPLTTGVAIKAMSWKFTTARAAQVVGSCPCSLYDETDLPAVAATTDTDSVELGTAFSTDTAGQITGVEFYKGLGNGGTHTVSLWTAGGDLLATATVTGETTTGWQVASFADPVTVTADTTYVVSYRAPQGRYAATSGAFAAPTDRSPLHTAANAGRYTYGSGAPTNASSASYLVDPVFTVPSTSPPAVASTIPVDLTTSVPLDTPVTVSFDAAVRPGSAVVTVTDGNGRAVAGRLSGPSLGRTVTFTPAAALTAGQTYTTTVTGAQNLGGTAMTAASSTIFTTAGATACPCSLLASTAVPAVGDTGDTTPITVGTRFTVSGDGYVLGLRYWRDAANTGRHTGALYTDAGQRLAGVTFADRGTGWQVAKLDTPVAVTADTTYLVAVTMPNGHYAAATDFFATPYTNGPITGVQGVYANGVDDVPSASYRNAYYYVDPLYTPSLDTTGPAISSVAVTMTGSTATISWTTSEPATGTVTYGTSPTALSSTATAPGTGVTHTARLTGLVAGTTYSYRIASADAAGNTSLAPGSGTASWTQLVNVAVGKTATQSSLYGTGYEAARAVDDRTDGKPANGSISYTRADNWSWWQVDLGASYRADQVIVWNRTDALADRLKDYWVFVSDSPLDTRLTPAQQALVAGVRSVHQTSQPTDSAVAALPAGATGRYVLVQQGTQRQVLSLAEVQVMGAPVGALSVSSTKLDLGSTPTWGTKTGTVTLANPGSAPVTISGVTAPAAPFSVSPNPNGRTLAPGESIALTVTYAPTTPNAPAVASSTDTGSLAVSADTGRTATIALTGVNTQPANLAQGKTATQSSTYGGYTAARAVDGRTTGTPAQTNADPSSWWAVDLGRSTKINQVVVWTPTDTTTNRMADYWVLVSDTPFDPTLSPDQQANQPSVVAVHLTGQSIQASKQVAVPAGTTGRYVMIQQGSTKQVLGLTEVQVQGQA